MSLTASLLGTLSHHFLWELFFKKDHFSWQRSVINTRVHTSNSEVFIHVTLRNHETFHLIILTVFTYSLIEVILHSILKVCLDCAFFRKCHIFRWSIKALPTELYSLHTVEVLNSNNISCSNSSLLKCLPGTQATRFRFTAKTCLPRSALVEDAQDGDDLGQVST